LGKWHIVRNKRVEFTKSEILILGHFSPNPNPKRIKRWHFPES
jgi:hypothetical protein